MDFELVALSDTHLGEDNSLLSYPHGLQHLWREMRGLLGRGDSRDEKIHIKELVLIGDIADRTLASTSQVITYTSAFAEMLGSLAAIDRIVYVPGNHDHTIWGDYACKSRKGCRFCITPPGGECIVEQGTPKDINSSLDILTMFFAYPWGSSWRAIEREKRLDFAIANPLYAREFNGRTYVFTHGTHFRKEIDETPLWLEKLLVTTHLVKFCTGLDIVVTDSVTNAKSMKELEQIVAPFAESIWPSPGNIPTPNTDEILYLYDVLRGKPETQRPAPEKSEIIPQQTLSTGLNFSANSAGNPNIPEITNRIHPLTDADESVTRFKTYFAPHLSNFLTNNNYETTALTFVYGDTHTGGYGELTTPTNSNIRLYNTGAWLVENKSDHPACHLFAVDKTGTESLIDITFANVMVGPDPLLQIAETQSEHNLENISTFARKMIDFLKNSKK